MAEKGLLIKDQIGGTSIATRDAYELDNLSNARTITRIMPASLHCPSPVVALRTGVTVLDSPDLSSLPTDLTDNVINCKDCTKLCVVAEFASAGSQNVYCTPIAFDNEGVAPANVLGILAEISLNGDATTSVFRVTGGTKLLSGVQDWDITGIAQIGMLTTDILNVTTSVNLWAWVI